MSTPASVHDWHPDRARAGDFSGKSNLALAFLCLGRDKRRDKDVFYTFCRLVDDIADESALPPEQKAGLLDAWRQALTTTPSGPPDLLAGQLHGLMARYAIPAGHLLEIIAGVEMDVAGRQYESF